MVACGKPKAEKVKPTLDTDAYGCLCVRDRTEGQVWDALQGRVREQGSPYLALALCSIPLMRNGQHVPANYFCKRTLNVLFRRVFVKLGCVTGCQGWAGGAMVFLLTYSSSVRLWI